MANIKTIFTLGALATLLLSGPLPCDAKTRVFLLSGQSNMAGQGNANELTGPLAPYRRPQKDVNIWRVYQTDHTKHTSSTDWAPLAPQFGNFYFQRKQYADRVPSFGPEVSFGKAMAEAYPNDDIYLIKHGWGGAALGGGWDHVAGKKSGVMTGGKGTRGLQYNLLTSTVAAALANLDKAKIDYEIEGMLWMQGESDSQNKYGGKDAEYKANLIAFIAQMRKDYGKNLLFVIGRIQPWPAGKDSLTRAAQQAVAENTKGVYWFDTDNLLPISSGHYTTKGQIELGQRFAEIFLPTKSSP